MLEVSASPQGCRSAAVSMTLRDASWTEMPPPERPKLPAASLLDVEAALAAYAATWAAGGQPCGSAQRPDDALMQVEQTFNPYSDESHAGKNVI